MTSTNSGNAAGGNLNEDDLIADTEAVVLVGGKGTRLRPLTISAPKPMLPTAGLPFLTHLLSRIRAAGIRRVEAITGENALRYAQEQERRVQGMSALLKVQPDEVAERVAGILDNVRALERELARLKAKLAASQGDELVSQAVEVGGVFHPRSSLLDQPTRQRYQFLDLGDRGRKLLGLSTAPDPASFVVEAL